jgi:hypothetical protein
VTACLSACLPACYLTVPPASQLARRRQLHVILVRMYVARALAAVAVPAERTLLLVCDDCLVRVSQDMQIQDKLRECLLDEVRVGQMLPEINGDLCLPGQPRRDMGCTQQRGW